VFITGASSGIGEGHCSPPAVKGHRGVLGARCSERIAAMVHGIGRACGAAFHQELAVTDLGSVKALSHRWPGLFDSFSITFFASESPISQGTSCRAFP
jgi:NADP-dependent 3-hydroxy acid dehydrogenase YdfG